MGQPAYLQFVTQAANARGWFFAKIAELATKTLITRVSATTRQNPAFAQLTTQGGDGVRICQSALLATDFIT